MANKEERLIRLIRREQAGKGGNYEEICELLFDEINNLVRPVCQSADESRKKVKKLFVRMLQQINEIDTNDDIHLWIAGFTTVTLYELLCKENGQIITYQSGNTDYPYSHIDDDNELKSKVRDYNDALANPKRYMYGREFFKKLTMGQIILFEMFCYEGFTIDEIQELLEIDKLYIKSELSAIREIVLGNDNDEIELISQDEVRPIKEKDAGAVNTEDDDIATIRAAVEAIVNNTIDEVNTESDGYKDIVSAVNAIKAEPNYDNSNDKLGSTLVSISREHINNRISSVIDEATDNDKMLEKPEDKSLTEKKNDNIEADYIDDYDDEEDDDECESIKPVKKSKKSDEYASVNDGNNKMLKILSVAIPSVAVVIFIVILLTSGAFKKKSSALGNMVTIAETKTAANKQEKTTQATTKTQATEKITQKTTAAKNTEQTTTSKESEKTTAATKTQNNNNNNTTQAVQQYDNQVDTSADVTQASTETPTQVTEAPTQATAAPTQATAAPTQATEGNTQATEGNTQATAAPTAAPTDAPTQATSAPTQADTVVDEKNGTALH